MTGTITTSLDSPIGPLTLAADGERLTQLSMADQRHALAPASDARRDDAWFAPITEQLEAYFAGELTSFEVELDMRGTEFQRRVWEGLRAIPYGTTLSYGELAGRVGNAKACRAVGLANGRNPVAIIVPCHRVIGADGTLTGFGGGLDRKSWLLEHETKQLSMRQTG